MTTASTPARVLYNLFWCTAPHAGSATVATESPATLSTLPPVEAIILFPAFLTPAVCSRSNAPFFEMLLLAPKGLDSKQHPTMNKPAHRGNHGGGAAERVNRYLKISSFLDPSKWATDKPLFDEPITDDLLKVTAVGKIMDGSPKLRDSTLRTDQLFRGRIDARFWDALDAWQKKRTEEAKERKEPPPEDLDTIFKARVHLSSLKNAGPDRNEIARRIAAAKRASRKAGHRTHATAPPGLWPTKEPQDKLISSVLDRKNGDDLKSGFGFRVDPATPPGAVKLASRGHAVRAYHPLFVHDELGFAKIGHIADLHINSRQHLLARTRARVVEAVADPATPDAEAPGSQPIGEVVNIYSDNVLSILEQLAHGEHGRRGHAGRNPIDVLLVGGDLIDHVKNVYPFAKHTEEQLQTKNVNASKIWQLVDLANAANYQPFVDHLTVYSMLWYFCDTHQKPVFVVSGNHDAYEEPYGISPRPALQLDRSARPVAPLGLPVPDSWLASVRGNEGIPADHNLTFYEAILAFGESYFRTALIKAVWLHPHLFEWFYTVFTPFADFAADLPKQRIVGLAWGDSEGKLLPSDRADAHGGGHLPRADQTVSDGQIQFFDETLADGSKKVVLFTHFTFVSYKNELPSLPAPRPGCVGTSTFSKQDWGTFEKGRDPLYSRIHQAAPGGPGRGPLLQCVFTGHSHRRGLYYLGPFQDTRKFWTMDTRDRLPWLLAAPLFGPLAPIFAGAVLAKRVNERVFGTLMFPIHPTVTPVALLEFEAKTPIIVSDSAGPVPRANVRGEFGEWGSDRPAGTFVSFSDDGVVDRVESVSATQQARTKPRAAVAIDYLHVNDGRGIVSIVGDEFAWGRYEAAARSFTVTFHEQFALLPAAAPGSVPRRSVELLSAHLHCRPSARGPFMSVPLKAMPPNDPQPGQPAPVVQVLTVHPDDTGDLLRILNSAKTPRFLSLRFKPLLPSLEEVYDFVAGGRWDFEIDCNLEGPGSLRFHWVITPKVEFPDFKLRRDFFPDMYGAPKP